jgi:hypothetical protein
MPPWWENTHPVMTAMAIYPLDFILALRAHFRAEVDSALVDPSLEDRISALEKQFHDFNIAIGQADRLSGDRMPSLLGSTIFLMSTNGQAFRNKRATDLLKMPGQMSFV